MRSENPRAAGRALSQMLLPLVGERPVVVGIPRGGVPVAFEIAQALAAPLDVLVVAKLRAPRQWNFAIGAVAEDGTCIVNEPLVRVLGVGEEELTHVKGRARDDLSKQVVRLRGGNPALPVRDRTVILADDGLLTGASAAAAARVLKQRGAARLLLAAPCGTDEGLETIRCEVDDVVLLDSPCQDAGHLMGVSSITDEEVEALLAEGRMNVA